MGPRRLISPDHPVYEMSAEEQTTLLKKGVDPVTAAEFTRVSRQWAMMGPRAIGTALSTTGEAIPLL